ncbi:MAG: hypothetical protein ABIT08_05080 [Bacteroidia bacterium]
MQNLLYSGCDSFTFTGSIIISKSFKESSTNCTSGNSVGELVANTACGLRH